jgi:general secretion pathway protein G
MKQLKHMKGKTAMKKIAIKSNNSVNRQLSTVNSSRSGFTLIEIMVVVFIIGILLAIVAPRLVSRTDDARVVEAKAQIKNFETALKLFKIDNGYYPTTEQGLETLITKPSSGQIPKNYKTGGYLEKRKIAPDPWGNPYIYISPGMEGDYDIVSYGADGIPGGEEYDADITNSDI